MAVMTARRWNKQSHCLSLSRPWRAQNVRGYARPHAHSLLRPPWPLPKQLSYFLISLRAAAALRRARQTSKGTVVEYHGSSGLHIEFEGCDTQDAGAATAHQHSIRFCTRVDSCKRVACVRGSLEKGSLRGGLGRKPTCVHLPHAGEAAYVNAG